MKIIFLSGPKDGEELEIPEPLPSRVRIPFVGETPGFSAFDYSLATISLHGEVVQVYAHQMTYEAIQRRMTMRAANVEG